LDGQANGTPPFTLAISWEEQTLFTGLLDTYSGAAAAYSLRKLDKDYAGSAVRVRRASDNTEQDIGFDGNGDLDTSALTTFCTGTNGFIRTWYDQSGNVRNAGNATSAEQPKIYDSSTGVLTLNGKPGVQWDNTDDYLSFSFGFSASFFHLYSVYRVNDTQWIMISDNSSRNIPVAANNAFGAEDGFNTLTWYKNGSVVTNTTRANTLTNYNTNAQLLMTIEALPDTAASFTALWGRGGAAFTMNAMHQELVIYTSNQSANRTGIETNINDYYSIY